MIVGLQPILTNIFSGPILKEKVNFVQWIGITLGFIGTVMVIGNDIGISIPILGVIASIIALLGATTATIWQKRFTNNISSVSYTHLRAHETRGNLVCRLLLEKKKNKKKKKKKIKKKKKKKIFFFFFFNDTATTEIYTE